MSTDQLEGTHPSSHRGLHLVLSPGNCYPSISESPDSNSSISNMSGRGASSSPDSNMLGCINECSLEYNYYNVKSAASNTFTVTSVSSGDGAGLLNQLNSFEVSNSDSSVDDCCFLSSGEMVTREKLSPKVVSSLYKSSDHPAECPAVTLLHVDEMSTERETDNHTGHPCYSMTKENDIAASTSHRALSSESEKGLLVTFTVCENSALSGTEAVVTNPEAEMLPYFSGRVTPEKDKTFVFTPVMPNCVHDNQISTPVPDNGKNISRLLSFSESPCIGSANRPGPLPVTQRQILVTREKSLVSGLPTSATQDHKIEVRKTDLWNVKPKMVTRSCRRMTGSTSQHKSSQVNVNNKCTVTRRGTSIRVGSPKMSTSTAVDGHRSSVNSISARQYTNTIISSFKKSSVKSAQMDSKAPLKNGVSDKINIKSGSALDQVRLSVCSTQPRHSSESSSLTSRPPKEKRRVSAGDTILDTPKGRTKPGNVKCSSGNKRAIDSVKTNSSTPPTEVPKPRMLARSSKLTAAAGVSLGDCKSRFQRRTLNTTPRSQSPGGTRKPQGKRSSMPKSERTAQSKQQANASLQGIEPLHRSASAANIKPQLCGSPLPQTPTRPSLTGPPRKGLTESRGHSQHGASTGKTLVSGAAVHKPTQLKSVGLKARLISKQNTGPSLTTACKPTATTGKGASTSTVSLLKRTVSTRHGGPTSVDKTTKSKTSSHQQHPYQRASQPNHRTGPQVGVPAATPEGEKKDQSIQTDCNTKYDAVSIILQKALVEFDDAQKKCRGLSQELTDLQGELVFSLRSSECLEKEKELHELLQAKWDNSKALMQQQIKELEASHEAMKLELENKHEQLQYVKQQHEISLEELRKTKNNASVLSGLIEDLTAKNNALIEKLTAEEIRSKELAEKTENQDDTHVLYLNKELESLKAVLDMKNKQLHEQEKKLMDISRQTEKTVTMDESLKIQQENNDSHILYLEQELDSVKVVLDIKNKQLHQLEKRLMDLDQLTEKNATLDESLKKTQQENEHLRARMERQAALSRQLSTEQATLQEYLQKESQLNKRLSMENEELLWKLNNGDLSSSHKMSPTSTSSPISSFTLQSPHSSSLSSNSALSPR